MSIMPYSQRYLAQLRLFKTSDMVYHRVASHTSSRSTALREAMHGNNVHDFEHVNTDKESYTQAFEGRALLSIQFT